MLLSFVGVGSEGAITVPRRSVLVGVVLIAIVTVASAEPLPVVPSTGRFGGEDNGDTIHLLGTENSKGDYLKDDVPMYHVTFKLR